MKTFEAIRKPIYIATVVADSKDFPFTVDVVNLFIMKHPEYKDCSYDRVFKEGKWIIKFYRECAIDFVE